MLHGSLIHPGILHALGRAGHGSRVLIADGNYPHSTARGPQTEMVFLNLAPGLVGVTDVLRPLVQTICVEHAAVMQPNREGPHAMAHNPPVFKEFEQVLTETVCGGELEQLERFDFYEAARSRDVCLIIATAEMRIYANLLLTIGVVQPSSAA